MKYEQIIRIQHTEYLKSYKLRLQPTVMQHLRALSPGISQGRFEPSSAIYLLCDGEKNY